MIRNAEIDAEQLASRLHNHVHELATEIGPRHPGEPGTMDATLEYINEQLTGLGYSTNRERYEIGDCEVANLITERKGEGRPDEIVIVGAHYDSIPVTPGADDNASAVAMLIEVANILKDWIPKRTLRLVAFACEEPPYYFTEVMGSAVHAAGCRERGENIHAMICLEMVGYFTTEPDSQQIPDEIPKSIHWAFPRRGDFLAAVGNLRSWRIGLTFRRGFKRAVKFPLFSISLPESVYQIRMSDHASFWDQGYKGLMITDTSFLRNPHYHMMTDTTDTLDFERMARGTIGVAGGVARLLKARRK